MFQNGPMIALSAIGPTTFEFQRRMLGSGSRGSATLVSASTGSAFLLFSWRTDSTRLLSTVSSSGSTAGTFTRCQFWPENLGACGMFAEQKMLQLLGENDVRTCA